jgi:Zn-dependent protease
MHFSTVILPIYPAAWLLADSGAPSARHWGLLIKISLIIQFVIFGCVIVHEISHAIAAKLLDARVKGVLLHPIGGACVIDLDQLAPRRNLIVSAAGPLANLALAGILSGFHSSHVLHGFVNLIWPTLILSFGPPLNQFFGLVFSKR